MKRINKYLLILISCAVLFTACRALKEEAQEKVVNGKVVTVNSKGEVISSSQTSESSKINVGYLIWWAAVFAAIALGVRHYMKSQGHRHE